MDTDPIGSHPGNHKFRDEARDVDVLWSPAARPAEVRRRHCAPHRRAMCHVAAARPSPFAIAVPSPDTALACNVPWRGRPP